MGTFGYALVAVIGGTSVVATFFGAVPVIGFYSCLRSDPSLGPLPTVANLFLGLFVISRFGEDRSFIPLRIRTWVIDSSIAFAVAVAVNLFVIPDRASKTACNLLASELQKLGNNISRIATKTFSVPYTTTHAKTKDHLTITSSSSSEAVSLTNSDTMKTHQFSAFVDDGVLQSAIHAGLHAEDYLFLTRHVPRAFANTSTALELTEEMIKSAEQSLAHLQHIRPFGRTRVEDYANLARIQELLTISLSEPHFLFPTRMSRWRNPRHWKKLLDAITALVTKVSSLESVACCHSASPTRFSQESLFDLFGEAYIPFWVSHFASCAAACAAMSSSMSHASRITQSELSFLTDSNTNFWHAHLDGNLDPQKWRRRRAEMYFGFLVRYRLRVRNSSPLKHYSSAADLRTLESRDVVALDTHQRLRQRKHGDDVALDKADIARMQFRKGTRNSSDLQDSPIGGPALCDCADRCGKRNDGSDVPRSIAEWQALSFFGTASHALSEEVSHVQRAVFELGEPDSLTTVLVSPFYCLVSALPVLYQSVKKVVTFRLVEWELRFALTHAMLLLLVLGLALLLPVRERFEAGETAWVYTAAAIVPQISAEPTLFIGLFHASATVGGSFLGYGYSEFLNAIGRDDNPELQYLIIPYVFVVSIAVLLLIPPRFRYSAFLLVVTSAIMLFCPRSIPECNDIVANQSSVCYPDWRYAVSRSANVSVGTVIALVFHIVFWPRFANLEALRILGTAFINAARLMGKLRRTYFSYGLNKVSITDWTVDHVKRVDESADLFDSLEEGDLFREECPVLREIQDKVSSQVAAGILTVNTQAATWNAGPLRLRPLLPQLLPDFVALNISLREMASLLGRRPIFSSSYRRSVYDLYIRPVLSLYETIHVSLNNLVGITDRAILDRKQSFLKENALDLHQAIIHLARTRDELRAEAELRSKEFEERSDLDLCVRERPSLRSETSLSASILHRLVDQLDMGVGGYHGDSIKTNIRSIDDLTHILCPSSGDNLSVDDVVLYNSFSFIADGCLSAFVRIAVVVLTDIEAKIDAKQKMKKRLWRK